MCRRQEHICHFINGCSVYRFSVRHSPPQLDVFWWRPFNRSSTELRFLDNSWRHRGLSRNQALLINGSCAIGLSELSPSLSRPFSCFLRLDYPTENFTRSSLRQPVRFTNVSKTELSALLPKYGFPFMENCQVLSGKKSLPVKGCHR